MLRGLQKTLFWRRFKRWYRRPFRRLKHARVTLNDVPEGLFQDSRVSILLPTYNRCAYLQRGIPSLLAAVEELSVQVIVWNNNSSDGTQDFLESINDDRVTVVNHPKNIGINALAASARLATGTHILQLDDDVIWFPKGFLKRLLYAYHRVPDMGYLGTNVIADDYTDGGRLPLWRSVRVWHKDQRNDDALTIDYGPVGGWCTLTDRDLYDQLGGFLEKPNEIYFWADLDYYKKSGAIGRKRGILEPVKVYHAFRVAPDAAQQAALEGHKAERDPSQAWSGPKLAPEFWPNFDARYPTAE